jgi:Rod binding domain-containing protein
MFPQTTPLAGIGLTVADAATRAGDRSQAAQADKIRQAAEGFERALLRQMLKELRSSSLSTGQTLVSQGYSQIGDDHLADHLARAGGLGLADAMARQMIGQIQRAGLTKAS